METQCILRGSPTTPCGCLLCDKPGELWQPLIGSPNSIQLKADKLKFFSPVAARGHPEVAVTRGKKFYSVQ